MGQSVGKEWTPAAAALAAIGGLLLTVFAYDIVEDVFVQGTPRYLPFLENTLPIVLAIGVALTAGYLVRSELGAPSHRRVVMWVIVSVGAVALTAGWVYYLQTLEGRIKPWVILAQLAVIGAVGGIAVGVYDSQQRRQRRRIVAEKTRIEALFENGTDCIAAVTFDGDTPVVRDVNPAFEATFGYPVEEIRGRSLDEVIVPPEADDEATAINDRARSGDRFAETVRRRTADGDHRTFRLRAIPLSEEGLAIDGYAVYTDVTERQRYAQRLADLHDATRRLMAADVSDEVASEGVRAADEVLGLDLTGAFLATEDESALEPAAVTDAARDRFETVPPIEEPDSPMWRVYEQEEVVRIEDIEASDLVDEPLVPIRSVVCCPIGDHGVVATGASEPGAFSGADVSLLRVLASNVEAALDRIGREAELRRRESELERQNERLEAFASVVSHDLRNPLTVAHGRINLAERDPESAGEHLADAEASLDRMEALIEDLLALAREGDAIGDVEPADPAGVAESAWTGVAGEEATLETEPVGPLAADRSRLRQLFENLFRNAVEHGSTSSPTEPGDSADPRSASARTEAGDSVHQDSTRSPARALGGSADPRAADGATIRVGPLSDAEAEGFYVEDDGPGIPEGEREQIFEFGYTNDGETGLGLAIVREIARAHGWEVRATESAAGGARFEITV